MKYIIKNCPACCNYAGIYSCEDNHDEQGRDTYCENIENCLLKRIVELCKDKITFCEKCSKKADLVYDCVDCNEGGEAHLARAIMSNFLEIEEVNEE